MKKILLMAISLLSVTANADNNNDVENLIVTATRSEQPSIDIPASIQIVTADEIQLSGATNIASILNTQAGIQINDNIGDQGRGASVSLRGFGENSANNVLILVDGRKLNNPSLRAPDLSSIAIKDVERIEIIQGSAGTLYGDQATGGVINIITKKPEQLSGYIETTRGTHDYERYQGSISQGFDTGISYRISGEKRLADNFRINNESNYSNVLANIAFNNAIFGVFIEAGNVQDDLALPGAISSIAADTDREQSTTIGEFTNRDTDTYRIGGNIKLSKQFDFLAEYTSRETENKGLIFSTFNFEDETDLKTFEPRLAANIETNNGPIIITTGVDWEKSELISSLTASDIDQEITDYYLQATIPVTQEIKITTGTRLSNFDFENNLANTEFDEDLSVFQLGASYRFNKNTRLFARIDDGFRWANVDENGFIQPSIDFLEPQESESIEIGFETTINELSLSILAYHLELENEIIFDPTVTGPSSIFGFDGANINIDKSERQGIIFGSSLNASDKFTIKFNYSYVDAEISSGTFDGNDVPFVAEQTANVTASYQLNEQWSVYADAQYTGQRLPANDQSNLNDKLGGYTIFNASVRWDLEGYYAQLRLSNITGKQYNGFQGGTPPFDFVFPAQEETYQLSIGYTF